VGLDASVLIPVLVADAHTTRAVAWYSNLNATLIVSDLANLEVSAVVSRDLCKGRLTQDAAENALQDFDAMRANCERLSHGAADFLLAERIVRDLSTNYRRPTPCIWRARRTPAGRWRRSTRGSPKPRERGGSRWRSWGRAEMIRTKA
jgi:hypothetical protein